MKCNIVLNMSQHTLEISQNIPAPIEKIWDFISSPHNLKAITPPSLGFDIVSEHLPEKMYAGMWIAYTVKPILGIPMRWISEITHIHPMQYFIDEQRVGPYRIWHHEHHLQSMNGYVQMKDIIHYALPFGVLGHIANAWLVRRKLRNIFTHRRKALEGIFGSH